LPPPPITPAAIEGKSFTALAVTLAIILNLLLIGCAVPGEPGPRRPLTPEPVRDLAGRQQGDAVVLNFTLPRNSTDQRPLAESPTIDIYRSPLMPAASPGTPVAAGQSGTSPPSKRSPATASAPQFRLIHTIPGDSADTYEHNGRVEFHDSLDRGDLERSPGGSLLYQVRTRLSVKHASAPSNSLTLRVYPAPPPVATVQFAVTQDAILLSWTPPSTAAGSAAAIVGYRVYRAEVDPASAAAAAADPEKAKLRTAPELIAPVPQPSYRDEHFEFDRTYLYIVRSFAQSGADTVESSDSTVMVSAKDVFPPAAPQGLEIIVTPATPAAPASIELVWAISPEPDFAGYEVYRGEQQEGMEQRLNPDLLPAPTFRDMTVAPGRQYFYRVRAVDRAGNESPFSAPVAGRVPAPQP
jgi:hypothetical protein